MEKEIHLPASSDSEKPEHSDCENAAQSRTDPSSEDVAGLTPRLASGTGPATSPSAETTTDGVTDASPEGGGAGAGAAAAAQSPIPNGGLQAWLQVLGSWVVLVATWGLVNTFGVYQTYYETELLRSSSSSAISWIGSLQASLLLLTGVVTGPLYDAGHFRLLLLSGLSLIVLGQLATSFGTAYWHILLAQGLCVGLGMGLAFLPSTAVLAQYFTTRRALAIGLSSSGSPLAGIVFPVVFSRLLPAVGFGWATRVIALVLLALSAVPVAFMRTRVPPQPAPGQGGGRRRRRALVDREALRDPAFVWFVAGAFFAFLCLYTAFFYVQLFAQLRGLAPRSLAPYTVTLLNVGSVFGRLLPNYLADRAGSLNVCIGCAAASAALLFGWLGIRDLGGLVAFALLYGLASGGIVSVLPSAVMSMAPDMARVGTRMGMTFMLTGTSILVGTPIAGWILGDFSDARWKGVMGYSAAGVTLSVLAFAASRTVLYRRDGKKIA